MDRPLPLPGTVGRGGPDHPTLRTEREGRQRRRRALFLRGGESRRGGGRRVHPAGKMERAGGGLGGGAGASAPRGTLAVHPPVPAARPPRSPPLRRLPTQCGGGSCPGRGPGPHSLRAPQWKRRPLPGGRRGTAPVGRACPERPVLRKTWEGCLVMSGGGGAKARMGPHVRL